MAAGRMNWLPAAAFPELHGFSLYCKFLDFLKNIAEKWLTNHKSSFIITYVACESSVTQKWRNRQTRTVQVRVVVIPCGFDSHLLHQIMIIRTRFQWGRLRIFSISWVLKQKRRYREWYRRFCHTLLSLSASFVRCLRRRSVFPRPPGTPGGSTNSTIRGKVLIVI